MVREGSGRQNGVTAHPETLADDTRQLILRVADAEFGQHGYAGVSMNALVEAISQTRPLTKGSLYYYFADKEALFLAVLTERVERIGRLIAQAIDTDGPIEQRVGAVVGALQSVVSSTFVRDMCDKDEYLKPASCDIMKVKGEQAIQVPLVAFFEKARERGEMRRTVSATDAAQALMGLVLSFLAMPFAPTHSTQLTSLIADIFLYGVAESHTAA